MLELVTMCCEGKSTISEKKSQESILSFSVATQIMMMAESFWPLKIAVMNYINHCFLDSADKSFLAKPSEEDNEGDDAP